MLLPRSASRRAALVSALLLALSSTAAFAADQPCKTPSGAPIAGDTNQGHETGIDNTTCAPNATAVGHENNASAAGGTAIGYQNEAFAVDSTAVGRGNIARGLGSLAMGFTNEVTATANYATAVGRHNTISADRGVAMGSNNNVIAVQGGVALGRGNQVSGDNALAVGTSAQATTEGSVAIGSWSVADRGNAVSFGSTTLQRQLINVAAGTASTDAVNLGQLFPVMSALGGGASYAGGVFVAPSFSIQGGSYSSVAAAFSAVDARLAALAGGGGATQAYVDKGDAATLDAAMAYTDNKDSQVMAGVHKYFEAGKDYADAGDAATLAAANDYADNGDRQVLAAAKKYYEAGKDYADAGDTKTLAASKSYTDDKSAQTLTSAKAYTDQKLAAWNDSFTQLQQQMDRRFARTDRRIDRVGAMGTAMTQMAVNAAIGHSQNGRIAVGIGGQGSQGAVSIGYGKRIGDRASFSFGASFSGSESSAGAGFGFDL